MTLPTLKWKPSPNFSSRHGAAVDLAVLHDCQGSYLGSITTFLGNNNGNPVSAHFVLKDDGSEVTQMVDLADKAWHAVDLNPRSVGLEMAGYAERGYSDVELDNAAKIMAYLCHTLGVPARHARGGAGAGIESHYGLGKAGGGHSDPSVEPDFMDKFVARVQAHMGDSVPAGWARNRLKRSRSPVRPAGPFRATRRPPCRFSKGARRSGRSLSSPGWAPASSQRAQRNSVSVSFLRHSSNAWSIIPS